MGAEQHNNSAVIEFVASLIILIALNQVILRNKGKESGPFAKIQVFY
ncbi:hypothetical protein SapgrDRAFT_2319 [Saprospira grandis DSM 2844]|uniref:Uncharacterized protein n=1 Tax=Saprospira grandis DSM 2844 TaxID=694433 RepID=J0P8U6_9BACT|nr:hypothetical protein [Saprospira grandis]EJF53987.1 hypothetical protein SapgrDRAFT_2319 [Saprospira grandis DSM 2844]